MRPPKVTVESTDIPIHKMSHPKPLDIAIIGGGITGVTLAIALAARSIRCTLYEQSSRITEIGAGVGIHPGAVRALSLCDPRLGDAFDRVASHNAWPAKRHVWFDCLDGMSETPAPELKPLFEMVAAHGGGTPSRAVHRARFMDELVKLLPEGIARFGKRLQDISVDEGSGKLSIKFRDGTVAEADAVLACDGIKSRTREIIVGEDQPGAKCGYSHKYAYRGLIPMQDAIKALGAEKAENAVMWVSLPSVQSWAAHQEAHPP